MAKGIVLIRLAQRINMRIVKIKSMMKRGMTLERRPRRRKRPNTNCSEQQEGNVIFKMGKRPLMRKRRMSSKTSMNSVKNQGMNETSDQKLE